MYVTTWFTCTGEHMCHEMVNICMSQHTVNTILFNIRGKHIFLTYTVRMCTLALDNKIYTYASIISNAKINNIKNIRISNLTKKNDCEQHV